MSTRKATENDNTTVQQAEPTPDSPSSASLNVVATSGNARPKPDGVGNDESSVETLPLDAVEVDLSASKNTASRQIGNIRSLGAMFCDELEETGSEFFISSGVRYVFWRPKAGIGGISVPVDSDEFERWVFQHYIELGMPSPDPGQLAEIRSNAKNRALSGVSRDLSPRFASDADGTPLVDLGDKLNRVARLTASGVTVEIATTPTFRRSSHGKELVLSGQDGGDLIDMIDNLVPIDRAEVPLLIAWLVSAVIFDVSSPILVLTGPQGSGKSTLSLILRNLIDPSSAAALARSGIRETERQLWDHAVPIFENVDRFERRRSDLFCQAVTGTTVDRRQLFTDARSLSFFIKRPIIINGLNVPTVMPDFLDRCLVFQLKRIREFRTASSVSAGGSIDLSAISAAILNLAGRAYGAVDSTAHTAFRMSGFAILGRAVFRELGQQEADFDTAFRKNLRDVSDDAYLACPISAVLFEIASEGVEAAPVEATMTELLEKVELLLRKRGLLRRTKPPANARALSEFVRSHEPILHERGVRIERRRSGAARNYQLYVASPSVATGTNGGAE